MNESILLGARELWRMKPIWWYLTLKEMRVETKNVAWSCSLGSSFQGLRF